jgi:hypothetical protein
MPLFRIYRMKESPRQQFRWAPHVSGAASVKPKDYERDGEIEALHDYDAWRLLRDENRALVVGDLLEGEDGRLRICKYVGFDPAEWVLPEQKAHSGEAGHPAADAQPEPAAAGEPQA